MKCPYCGSENILCNAVVDLHSGCGPLYRKGPVSLVSEWGVDFCLDCGTAGRFFVRGDLDRKWVTK